jgi:hypothetical protein
VEFDVTHIQGGQVFTGLKGRQAGFCIGVRTGGSVGNIPKKLRTWPSEKVDALKGGCSLALDVARSKTLLFFMVRSEWKIPEGLKR